MCLDISKPICRACTAKFCHSCSIWSALPPPPVFPPRSCSLGPSLTLLWLLHSRFSEGRLGSSGGASLLRSLPCLGRRQGQKPRAVGTRSSVGTEPQQGVLVPRGVLREAVSFHSGGRAVPAGKSLPEMLAQLLTSPMALSYSRVMLEGLF